MLKAKDSKQKTKKKMSISLSEREGEMLRRYADELGISRPAALRRILKSFLGDYYRNRATAIPQNQLDIFDSVQIDIFNNTSKT